MFCIRVIDMLLLWVMKNVNMEWCNFFCVVVLNFLGVYFMICKVFVIVRFALGMFVGGKFVVIGLFFVMFDGVWVVFVVGVMGLFLIVVEIFVMSLLFVVGFGFVFCFVINGGFWKVVFVMVKFVLLNRSLILLFGLLSMFLIFFMICDILCDDVVKMMNVIWILCDVFTFCDGVTFIIIILLEVMLKNIVNFLINVCCEMLLFLRLWIVMLINLILFVIMKLVMKLLSSWFGGRVSLFGYFLLFV